MKLGSILTAVFLFGMTACSSVATLPSPSPTLTPSSTQNPTPPPTSTFTIIPTSTITLTLTPSITPSPLPSSTPLGFFESRKYGFSLTHPKDWAVFEKNGHIFLYGELDGITIMARSFPDNGSVTVDSELDKLLQTYLSPDAGIFDTSTLGKRGDFILGDNIPARMQEVKGKAKFGTEINMQMILAHKGSRFYLFILLDSFNTITENPELLISIYKSIRLTDVIVEASTPESPTLKIAILAPITGLEPSSIGASYRDGALLAIKQWNDNGGLLSIPIKAIVEDTQCELQPAENATWKVIYQDEVHYIIGDICMGSSSGIAEIANKNNVVQIYGRSNDPNVVVDMGGVVRPYSFEIDSSATNDAKGSIKFARENLNAQTAFILYTPDYKDFSDFIEKNFSAAGGKVIRKATYTASDISTVLSLVKKAKPDVVFVPDEKKIAILVLKQANAMHLKVPFLWFPWVDTPEADLDLQAAEGSYFPGSFSLDENRPVVQNFAKLFGETYKDDKCNPKVPDVFAVLAYDATCVMLESIQKAGIDDPTKVKETIANGKFEGVTGPMTFDAYHYPIKSAIILQVEGEKVIFKSWVAP